MQFVDRFLKCSDCGEQFVFTAGEQLFFHDKQFKNDPKRCKPCKAKRAALGARAGGGHATAGVTRTETRTECSECHIETTVPFKPTQGRPVLCRQCFQGKRVAAVNGSGAALAVAPSYQAAAPAYEMTTVTVEAIAEALLQPQA
jgi:CxxC-x17-CxxC domain-containing protein